ncbi:hypothetical protein D3C86_2263730 [compost metagenome]
MAWLNSINIHNERLEKNAFDKFKKLLLNAYPHISREQTSEEKEKVKYYLESGFDEYL